MRWALAGFAVLSLAAGISAHAAEEKCQLVIIASVDIGTDPSGGVYVPMKISNHDENLLVDTGGTFSMLTSDVTDELGLARREISPRIRMTLYGGIPLTSYVYAHSIRLGTLTADGWPFVVMPDGRMHPSLSGTLAPDIMRNYDVEFDFAKAKMNFISHDHCEGKVVYWTHDPYAQIPLREDLFGQVTIPVFLDGREFNAALDTGSSRSVMRLERARSAFGWDERTAELKPSDATKPDDADYHYPFKALTFEGITVRNPDIVMVPDKRSRMYGGPELIVGMGILRQLHLYIAYKERNIYATAAGSR